MNVNQLRADLERDEGCVYAIYLDHLNLPTLGVGHLITQKDPEAAQLVVANMMFNLGLPRFSKFKKMIRAIELGDWQSAADEMIDSKWYQQVTARARRLEAVMRSV